MASDPEVFGGFLLVRRLAESRMASVYLAVRLADSSGKPLVLKRTPLGERPSGRAAQAILRESEVLSEVRGAGIPALEGAGEIAGLPYVVLERLRGASLAKILATGGPLPPGAARAIGRDVGRALAKLCEAGWIHRDVTPSNVLVDDTGEAYLLDFGLCSRAGDERGAAVAGTRGYVAPEAATSPAASPAQDVYGLAVCLAEATTGRHLFDEASLVEAAGRGDAPPQAAALEPQLPGITAALRRDPGARPSAADFASGLDHDLDRGALAAFAEAARERPSLAPADRVSAAGARERVPFGPPAARDALREAAVPPLVTPTVSMPPIVTVRDLSALPTLPDGAIEAVPAEGPGREMGRDDARGAGAAQGRGPLRALVTVLLVALIALVIGFLSGRLSARSRGASFAIAGPTPRRAEVFLDGRKLTIADGVPMHVPPGAHTLTIASPKTGRREIPFQVRPGEHVVILSATRTGGSGDDDGAP